MYQDFDPLPIEEQFPENCDCISQRKYASILRKQLIRMFGKPPEGVHFKTCFNDHDFGGYITLKIIAIGRNEEAMNYFQKIDQEFPANWDEEALREIANTQF